MSQSEELSQFLAQLALSIEKNDEPDPSFYAYLLQYPESAFELIDSLNELEEEQGHEDTSSYSALVFALDICVAQLQAAAQANNKLIGKILEKLMAHLAKTIHSNQHGLGFWLPVLNAFYEAQVDLTEVLKNAYFTLAMQDTSVTDTSELSHLEAIKSLIAELSDLSIYEIAEHFFAQSYAMPPDFFSDLVEDLYSLEEGQDIALLTLLHPNALVREEVIAALDRILDDVTLSSSSLSRLEVIMHWYPEDYHPTFNRWIKNQRKKGVVFSAEAEARDLFFKATEVDGSGAQGLFIHVRQARKNRLGSLLLKYDQGIKDTWVTPTIMASEVKTYYQQAFDDSITLRTVDLSYVKLMIEHFLAITLEKDIIPSLRFLELYELLGVRLMPHRLDIDHLLEQLSIQISPFTEDVIAQSLKRSKTWLTNKKFTESWFLESPKIDKLVNHNSSFTEGVKVCRLDAAMDAVFKEEMEPNRDRWLFHFLWTALWMKAHERKNEKVWQDSFLIAYVIHQSYVLSDIPVMQEICRQTVIHSVETMQERRTHLSQE